jgi:hypothetical protein
VELRKVDLLPRVWFDEKVLPSTGCFDLADELAGVSIGRVDSLAT